MIIRMKPDAATEDIDYVVARVKSLGMQTHVVADPVRTVVSVFGDTRALNPDALGGLRGVDGVSGTAAPYRLASREYRPTDSVVMIGGEPIGGTSPIALMAGPCSVEHQDQVTAAAVGVAAAGANLLRGGAFKPRTSPYSFQGLADEGLRMLAAARHASGLPVVTEVMAPDQVPLVARYADALQIGTRNMQNFNLLRAVGEAGRPVLLKRGMMSTVEELLLSAEYVLAAGNGNVVLCERGIRTFETATRNTLDINAVPLLKRLTHLPVIVDPSHATGRADLVAAVSRAAIAAGADGLLVEVHPHPEQAWSDGEQSLTPAAFADLVVQCGRVAEAVGRRLPTTTWPLEVVG